MISPDVQYRMGSRVLIYMILKKLKYPLIFAIILVVYGMLLSLGHSTLLSWENGHSSILFHTAIILYKIKSDGWFFTLILALFLSLIVVPEYRGLTIRLGDKAFYVRRGLLTYREIAIPYRQIQTINIIEKAMPRMFGLCSLVVVTSAHDTLSDNGKDSEATLPIISKKLAQELQNELLNRSGATS